MKKLLIVVDYQKDFVDGSLGFKGAEKLEKPILKEIEKYEKNKDDVVFTFDTHDKDYFSTIEGKKLPILHCVKNTEGWKMYGKIQYKSQSHKKFCKPSFGSIDLGKYLLRHKYSEIELVGLVSNICVFTNAVIAKATCPNTPIIVRKDLTGSNDLSMQQKSFDVLTNLHIEVK